jgi:hypothetical protein
MNSSSSLLLALIGGGCDLLLLGMASQAPAKVVPRVAIASWKGSNVSRDHPIDWNS